MTRDEYITYLAEKVATGEIDFDRVRAELQRHGLKEHHIRIMIRLIDDEVISSTVEVARRERRSSYLAVGILMTIAGFISTFFLIGFGPVVYFIAYGPFATGLALIAAGLRGNVRSPGPRGRRVGLGFMKRVK